MTAITSTSTLPRPRAAGIGRRLFYMVMPALMALVVFVGFAPSYYLKSAYGTPALSPLYHLHGLLFTGWMLLMLVQPALVAVRRTDLHRRIGSIGAVLIVAMTVAAYLVSIDIGRRGAAPPGIPALAFMLVPLSTVVVFPALAGAALYWKHVPQTHKRLMLIATLELVPAGLGRIPALLNTGPLGFFGVTDLFIVAMLAYDRATTGRFHRATIYGGGFLVASQVARVIIGGTSAWQSFAGWLIS
jgi:hypothetical protein